MGAVYQAWDAELGVAVALKVIRADRRRGSALPAAEKRFKHELLLARQVTHKNVVRIHDLGEIDGIKYITMPYVAGRRPRDGPEARGQAAGRARAAARAADRRRPRGGARSRRRPPRPEAGEHHDRARDEHALIMDFGIAASAPTTAADGRIVGTLEYMAPEQGTGDSGRRARRHLRVRR